MQQAEEQKRGRGRRPASELTEKREREIAALAAAVAKQQQRLEELKEAQRKAQKSARRTYLNQRKFAVGGLAQIAGLRASFLVQCFSLLTSGSVTGHGPVQCSWNTKLAAIKCSLNVLLHARAASRSMTTMTTAAIRKERANDCRYPRIMPNPC